MVAGGVVIISLSLDFLFLGVKVGRKGYLCTILQ